MSFPFSHTFQLRLSKEITSLVEPSTSLIKKYGKEFELMFRISAKQALREVEIKGPTLFKKSNDIEYTMFLPFNEIILHPDAPKRVLILIFRSVCNVLQSLEIDTRNISVSQDGIISAICSDVSMLQAPSWNEGENNSLVRKIFVNFFGAAG